MVLEVALVVVLGATLATAAAVVTIKVVALVEAVVVVGVARA